jgi:hypothetical protein
MAASKVVFMPPSQPTTEEQVRALATALRDKYLADARQCMKVVRDLEQQYNLTPAEGLGPNPRRIINGRNSQRD